MWCRNPTSVTPGCCAWPKKFILTSARYLLCDEEQAWHLSEWQLRLLIIQKRRDDSLLGQLHDPAAMWQDDLPGVARFMHACFALIH